MKMNLTTRAGDDGANARAGGSVPAKFPGLTGSGFGGWPAQPPCVLLARAAAGCRRGGAARRISLRAGGRGCPKLVKFTAGQPVGAGNCPIMPLTVSSGVADNYLLFER